MQEQDPEVSGSDGSQSFNKTLLFQFHDFTADDPGKSDPGIDHDRDQHALHALSKKSGHRDHQRQAGKSLENAGDRRDDPVDPAAEISREKSQCKTEQHREDGRRQGEKDRLSSAIENTAQRISSDIIRA